MTSRRTITIRIYWGTTFGLLALAIAMALFYAPPDTTSGHVRKLLYLHVPAAIDMTLAAFVVFVASAASLWTRGHVWDRLAHNAALAAVLASGVVLVTGMAWARSAWGHWWAWSPTLTFSLAFWLLYVGYLVLRRCIRSRTTRAVVGAVYGIVALLDVPMLYLSAQLLPDVHPTSVALAPEAWHTLLVWFLAITLLFAGFIATSVIPLRNRTGHAWGRAHGRHRPPPRGVTRLN